MEADDAIRCVVIGNIADGVGREFGVCLLLRGRSATCASGSCRTNGAARMRLRGHEAGGAEWFSIVRLPEHVSEPIRRAQQATNLISSGASVIGCLGRKRRARV